jgi:potassium-transporting ATPase ATP-binding subunit
MSIASWLQIGVTLLIVAILVLTVWFANLAEALGEGRGKAHADALRQTRRNRSLVA